jgi:hypothetical protein
MNLVFLFQKSWKVEIDSFLFGDNAWYLLVQRYKIGVYGRIQNGRGYVIRSLPGGITSA